MDNLLGMSAGHFLFSSVWVKAGFSVIKQKNKQTSKCGRRLGKLQMQPSTAECVTICLSQWGGDGDKLYWCVTDSSEECVLHGRARKEERRGGSCFFLFVAAASVLAYLLFLVNKKNLYTYHIAIFATFPTP